MSINIYGFRLTMLIKMEQKLFRIIGLRFDGVVLTTKLSRFHGPMANYETK